MITSKLSTKIKWKHTFWLSCEDLYFKPVYMCFKSFLLLEDWLITIILKKKKMINKMKLKSTSMLNHPTKIFFLFTTDVNRWPALVLIYIENYLMKGKMLLPNTMYCDLSVLFQDSNWLREKNHDSYHLPKFPINFS